MNKKLWILLGAGILLLAILLTVLLVMINRDQTVGICYRDPAATDTAGYRDSLHTALEKQGYQVIVTDADNDQAKQLEQLAALEAKGCDVLIVEPVMADASQELLATLSRLELPAILIGKQPEDVAPSPGITYFGVDSIQAARVQAQMALSLPDHGDLNGDNILSYAILAGPEGHVSATALADTFCENLVADGLRTHLLTVAHTDWSSDSGKSQCLDMLATYGMDVEVIVCQSDLLAQGATAAVEESGWQAGTDYYLLAIGTQGNALTLIRDGKLTGTVFFDRDAYIASMVSAVSAYMESAESAPEPVISYQAVTAENLDNYS